MIRKLALCLALLLALCPAALADSEEEVSISIFDAEATPAPEEEQAEEPVDPTQPVYEADGSILLTMSFTGDVTIGANMQSDSRIFEKELKKQKGDINFPFRNVKEIFETDDLTMVNFEGTLTTAGRNKSKLDNDFLFRADPGYVTMLPDNGIDTVSLENNHVLDMGEDGLAETKKTLLEAGVSYASEDEPAILTVKGVKIGSLAYQTFGGRHDEIIAKLPGDIQALRDQGCQIVIVSYHWGAELDYAPNDNQVRLGRATIDAGADLVIGHHSHRINPIEYYNGKYICYSLGNFSFAGNNKPKDMSTFIFQIRMRVKDGQADSEAFRIIPCRISSRTDYNDFTPTPYTKDANIEAVVKTLIQNGKKLEYAVDSYPLEFPY
ncbi:MAG: CapA family protein [Candidatus Limiplasma sp.]|nr:CapA family protein [Clostridiales bacterium]MDY3817250.1 CapA family protein [Candidatus Limiplasma sp.]